MNKDVLTAFIVWAVDTDNLNLPVLKAWGEFVEDAFNMLKVYTDADDKLLFCKDLVGADPIEFFTDYILCYAKMKMLSDVESYGKLGDTIIMYNKKQLNK